MLSLRKVGKLLDPEIRAKNLRAAHYGIRGMYWRVMRPPMPDPIFVVGCSRAGTTVTFDTIRSTPYLLSFNRELPEFWESLWGPTHNQWASEAAGEEHARSAHRDAAFSFFFQRLGVGQVVDKTCINILRLPYLHALFPKSKFVYIHRDGRDNISSLMDGWRQRGRFDLKNILGELPAPVRIQGGEFRDWCFFLPPGWREYNEVSLEEVCAFQWITANRMALAAKERIPPDQWIQIRYEDLYERPVQTFQQVFECLGLPFEDKVRARCATLLERPTSIVSGPPEQQKWRKRNREAILRILDPIRPTMLALGYDPDH
jgi:hypothetical protein